MKDHQIANLHSYYDAVMALADQATKAFEQHAGKDAELQAALCHILAVQTDQKTRDLLVSIVPDLNGTVLNTLVIHHGKHQEAQQQRGVFNPATDVQRKALRAIRAASGASFLAQLASQNQAWISYMHFMAIYSMHVAHEEFAPNHVASNCWSKAHAELVAIMTKPPAMLIPPIVHVFATHLGVKAEIGGVERLSRDVVRRFVRGSGAMEDPQQVAGLNVFLDILNVQIPASMFVDAQINFMHTPGDMTKQLEFNHATIEIIRARSETMRWKGFVGRRNPIAAPVTPVETPQTSGPRNPKKTRKPQGGKGNGTKKKTQRAKEIVEKPEKRVQPGNPLARPTTVTKAAPASMKQPKRKCTTKVSRAAPESMTVAAPVAVEKKKSGFSAMIDAIFKRDKPKVAQVATL